jgi:hypothetical protein
MEKMPAWIEVRRSSVWRKAFGLGIRGRVWVVLFKCGVEYELREKDEKFSCQASECENCRAGEGRE